jgi:hypothetical protein
MILYVESNFPLELARMQEEARQAEELLQRAEAGAITLVFPAISITEPFSTLDRYANDRARFLQTLNAQLTDLARSQPHQPLVANLNPLVAALTTMRKDETDRLEIALERMLTCGTPIPLTQTIFAAARQAETQFDMSPQDAIVFASVLHHLDAARVPAGPAPHDCFVSRNSKDFTVAKAEFTARHCEYKPTFTAALAYIDSNAACP